MPTTARISSKSFSKINPFFRKKGNVKNLYGFSVLKSGDNAPYGKCPAVGQDTLGKWKSVEFIHGVNLQHLYTKVPGLKPNRPSISPFLLPDAGLQNTVSKL